MPPEEAPVAVDVAAMAAPETATDPAESSAPDAQPRETTAPGTTPVTPADDTRSASAPETAEADQRTERDTPSRRDRERAERARAEAQKAEVAPAETPAEAPPAPVIDQAAIDRAIEERWAAREREREQREAAERLAAQAKAEREEHFGTPEKRAELRAIALEPIEPLPEYGYVEPEVFAAHQQKLAAKNAALEELKYFEKLDKWEHHVGVQKYQEARQQVLVDLSGAYIAAASLPDVDPQFHMSSDDPYLVLKRMRDSVAENVARPKDAKIAELTAKLAEADAELSGYRTHEAGDTPSPTVGGTGLSNGALTPERYSRMSYDERTKLRSTPEGRARIDAMTRGG